MPHDKTKPDLWGNDPGSSMYGVAPDNDPYWKDRKHPHFREEVYWPKRASEFWQEMAESFWNATRNGDGDILESVFNRATPYFEELDVDTHGLLLKGKVFEVTIEE